MQFYKKDAQVFVPSSDNETDAFSRTTDLTVSAHPDDTESISYHAIEECFHKKDRHFSAIIVSDGAGCARTGEYADYSDEEMVAIRRVEQKKAAMIGEYSSLVMLDYTSSEVKDRENLHVVDDLYRLLMEMRPKRVYTQNLADKHDTHVATVIKTILAIRRMPKDSRPEKLYGCEAWRSLDWMKDERKIIFDVSRKPNLFAALFGVFDSQISGGKRYDEAIVGRRLANASFLESHQADTFTKAQYAMDLTPLIQNDDMETSDFILQYVSEFLEDVRKRVEKLESVKS